MIFYEAFAVCSSLVVPTFLVIIIYNLIWFFASKVVLLPFKIQNYVVILDDMAIR